MNGRPQYLIRHPNGMRLIEWSICGVFNEEFTRVIVVVVKEDAEKYDAESILLRELNKYPVEVVVLDEMTSGPAETVYLAAKIANVQGALVVKDADNYLKTKELPQGNFVAGLDLNTWDRDVHDLRNKSFLIVNEQGNLLDIIEKQVRSDVICLGLYGFKNIKHFYSAYERLIDTTYPISRLYLSHIISYLIGYAGRVFHYVESLEYENWGDDRLWKDMQRDYTLYFVDLDNILGEDNLLPRTYRDKLRLLQSRGASFIGYTVNDEEYKISALQTLEEAGIHFIKIVYGCPYSAKKKIIDSQETLERLVIDL